VGDNEYVGLQVMKEHLDHILTFGLLLVMFCIALGHKFVVIIILLIYQLLRWITIFEMIVP
jgi:hypothetical protein